jgi:microcystin-dependent protein
MFKIFIGFLLASAIVSASYIIENGAVTFAKLSTAVQQALIPTGTMIEFAGTSCPSGFEAADGTSYTRSSQANLYSAIGSAWGAVDGTHFSVPDMRGQFPRGIISNSLGGTISAVSGNSLTITGHGFNHSGVAVQFSGSLPTGLASGITLYEIYIDANTIQVAASPTLAISGTAISLSSTTTGGAAFQWVDPDFSSRYANSPGGSSFVETDQFLAHTHSFSAYNLGGGNGPYPSQTSSPTFTGTVTTSSAGGNETRPKNVYVLYCIKI